MGGEVLHFREEILLKGSWSEEIGKVFQKKELSKTRALCVYILELTSTYGKTRNT